MSMGKRPRRGGEEMDVFSRYWRRYMTFCRRPGVTARVKREARQRERRQGRQRRWEDGT